MKKISFMLVCSVFAVLVQKPVAFAYGALAIDENQGRSYGFSYNYDTSSDAREKALRECGESCYIVKTFSGSCAAYAADQSQGSNAYGFSHGYKSGSEAQSRAMGECRNRGGKSCIVRAWGCDSKD